MNKDIIYRQVAIDAICAVCGNDCDKSKFVYDAPQEKQVIICPEHYVLSMLPSAQTETSILTVTVAPDSEEIERVVRKIKDAPVMAVLSAQPTLRQTCDKLAIDCISRQAALDALEWKWAGKAAFDAIKILPSAQPEPHWTPCNERMPETTDYYLIQYSRHICQDEMAVAFYSVEEAELDKNYTWEFKPFADLKEVIAWMPLPEPYKEEQE